MKTVVDPCLIEEARRARLRFRCDDCIHFDDGAERCVHGYPVTPHRPGPLTTGAVIVFCKEFELGAGPTTPPG
jgi:hypothetical protein